MLFIIILLGSFILAKIGFCISDNSVVNNSMTPEQITIRNGGEFELSEGEMIEVINWAGPFFLYRLSEDEAWIFFSPHGETQFKKIKLNEEVSGSATVECAYTYTLKKINNKKATFSFKAGCGPPAGSISPWYKFTLTYSKPKDLSQFINVEYELLKDFYTLYNPGDIVRINAKFENLFDKEIKLNLIGSLAGIELFKKEILIPQEKSYEEEFTFVVPDKIKGGNHTLDLVSRDGYQLRPPPLIKIAPYKIYFDFPEVVSPNQNFTFSLTLDNQTDASLKDLSFALQPSCFKVEDENRRAFKEILPHSKINISWKMKATTGYEFETRGEVRILIFDGDRELDITKKIKLKE